MKKKEENYYYQSLFVFDIDGTLISSSHRILPSTKAALKKIMQHGGDIMLASARPSYSIRLIMQELGISIKFFAALNGALVYKKNQKIWGQKIDQLSILKLIERTVFQDIFFNFYTEEAWLLEKSNIHSTAEADIIDMQPKIVDDITEAVSDQAIYKILVLGSRQNIVNIKDWAEQNLLQINATLSKPNYCEMVQVGVSKAKAVKRIREEMGGEYNRIIVFGDGENDLEMMNYADTSIAMGNSNDLVKRNANYITRGNDQDGISYAINHILKI